MEVTKKPLEVRLKKGQEKVDERLNMLCDGVFAIAMTILVLDIRLELQDGDLNAALEALLYKVIIYLITFFVIAGYWSRHRRMMKMVKRIDPLFIQFTFLFLAFVTFFPVAFNMIMDAGSYTQVVIIYTLIVMGGGFSMLLLWWYACWHHRLVDPDFNITIINRRMVFGLVMPVVAGLSLLLIPLFPNNPSHIFYSWLLVPVISRATKIFYDRQKQHAGAEQQALLADE